MWHYKDGVSQGRDTTAEDLNNLLIATKKRFKTRKFHIRASVHSINSRGREVVCSLVFIIVWKVSKPIARIAAHGAEHVNSNIDYEH